MYVCSETKKINDFKYGLYKILFRQATVAHPMLNLTHPHLAHRPVEST